MLNDRDRRIHPAWWTAILLAAIGGIAFMTVVLFTGSLRSYVPVTLTSDRSGLVMEPGGKVKLRGLQVGHVKRITRGPGPVILTLEINPDQIQHIPANIEAQIKVTTAFGAKYVDLIYPDHPSPQRLSAGQLLESRHVTGEINTVFQNVVNILHKIDPAKLNAILSALSQGFRGQGPAIGEATTDANEVLLALNPRSQAVRADWRSLRRFGDAYSGAAQDIVTALESLNTTSSTITDQSRSLDALLLNVTGLANSGTTLLGASENNFIHTVTALEPTTGLLLKYNPELTCVLQGGLWFLDNGGRQIEGGNGKSTILDATITFGQDHYRFPENLPIVGAKGGPGGKPGCGSLPDPTKQYPLREMVLNTGWGTGNDIRVNPGIGIPGYADYFPVTRGTPRPPSVRHEGGPAPGPIPYPGAPPYGAQLYAPDGTPLFPGLPPAPPPGAPREPGLTPGSEPFTPAVPAQVQPTQLLPPPPKDPPPPSS